MKELVVFALLLGVGLVACSQQEPISSKANVPASPSLPSLRTADASASAAQPAAPVVSGDPPGKIEPSTGAKLPPAVARDLGTDGKPNLEALTAAMQDWCYWTDRFPTNVEELVTSKYLSSIPTPPAGQKYVVNRTGNRVELGAK